MYDYMLIGIAGILLGGLLGIYFQEKRIKQIRRRADKDSRIIDVQLAWLHLYQDGRSLIEFFHKHQYKRVAVQGLGKLGKSLIYEFNQSDIDVSYGIDRNTALSNELGIVVYSTDDSLPDVDAVIITAIADYNNIANQLYEKLDCPLIPLDAIMNEMIE